MNTTKFDNDPFEDFDEEDDEEYDLDEVLSNFSVKEFDKFFAKFCVENPFFSFFTGIIEKVPDKRLATIGVAYSLERNKFSIIYNVDFIKTLTLQQFFGVLEHEFYHIVLGHTQFRSILSKLETDEKLFQSQKKYWEDSSFDSNMKKTSIERLQSSHTRRRFLANVAKDLAINSLIERRKLPDIGVFPGEGQFKKYQALLSSEEYWQKLQNDQELKDSDINLLDHGVSIGILTNGEYEEIEDAFNDAQTSELNGHGCDKSMAFELLNQAITQASKIPNKVPSAVGNLAFKKIKKSIPWNKLLSQRVTRFSHGQKRSFKSITRINKRYPYIFAGTRKKTVLPKILVAIDESGSVGDEMYKTLVSTLFALKSIADFFFVPFTHIVHPPATLMKERNAIGGIKRRYSGGTNFQAVVEFAENEKYDFLIVLTDLLDRPPSSPPKKCIPRVFVADCYSQYSVSNFRSSGEDVILVGENPLS